MHGLKRRWMLGSLWLVVMIVLIAVTAYSMAAANYYTSNVQSGMESRARATANFFSGYANNSYSEYFRSAEQFAQEFADRDKLELQFINISGRVEVSTMGVPVGILPQTEDIAAAFKSAQVESFTGVDPLSGERVLSVSAPLLFGNNQTVGVMRYVTSLQRVDRQILMSTLTALLIGLVVTMFVVLSNLFFIRSIVTPLGEITEIAKKIAGGSYGARIEKKFNDEIGERTDTINNMSAEISLAEKMKSDFISSVSHELRTPLTAIAGWGETLLSADMRDVDEVKKGVRIMLKEANRLTKMVEELLDFTRMESGRMTFQMEEMDPRAELEEVVFLYMDTLARDGILLTYDDDGDIPPVIGDRARLRQVFLNILDNAAKHGSEGKRIEVSVFLDGGQVVVRVRDHGPGIAPDELPHVKLKFYKGASKSRGSGIGLAVSDEIIRRHDGHLDIDSTLGDGTTVTIRLPAHLTA